MASTGKYWASSVHIDLYNNYPNHVYNKMDDCAIFFYVGHGWPNAMLMLSEHMKSSFVVRGKTAGETPLYNDPSNQIWYIENMPDTANFPDQHDMPLTLYAQLHDRGEGRCPVFV